MKTVIAITGEAQAGKDTTADFMMKITGGEKIPFAEKLKDQANMLGWNGIKDEKGRKMLQQLGDVMRAYHGTSYYAAHVACSVPFANSNYVYVPDMRFKSEYETLSECAKSGAFRLIDIAIQRPGATLEGDLHEHQSEVQARKLVEYIKDSGTGYYIDNSGTLEDLDCKAREIAFNATKSGTDLRNTLFR